MWDEYTWIFVCSIFLALFVAWGIGANDVSNAFGTSVGAKALTMKQAIVIASFTEFGGAVLLGSGVTDTIKSGIAKVSAYTYQPDLLMYGMLCALLAAGIWLALATFLELPVSTTHSIVGAIIGMSLVAAGPDSIVWTSPATAGSPFPGGVVSIILAWFITSVMAAIVAALLFTFTKLVVLKARNPFRMSLFLFPLYTFITVWVVTYFIIQKGVNSWMKSKTYSSGSCPPGGTAPAKGYKTDALTGEVVSVTGCTIPDGTNAWISTVCAAVVTLICVAALKWVVKLVERDLAAAEAEDERKANIANGIVPGADGAADIEGGTDAVVKEGLETAADGASGSNDVPHNRTPAALQQFRKSKVWTTLAYSSNVDIHEVTETDEKIKAMHADAEVFDRKTEFSFKYLQVLTACANSFAHGANDVANAIGSLAAVYAIWECGCANSKAAVPIWMFVIGGVGLVLGLATYGYKIMRALGVKMTKLTNSRGYCAELTAAIIVIVASRYGFPVSTTQVITGAITGIGIQEVITAKLQGKKNAGNRFNWMLLLKFFCGWVATLIVSGVTAAAFTAQGIYAPSRNAVRTRVDFNSAFNATNEGISQTLIATGDAEAIRMGEEVKAATVAWSTSTDINLLDSNVPLGIFQQGSWALGNASLAGVVFPPMNGYMPNMPLTVDGI